MFSQAYHILEEFSLQKDTYFFDLVYDTDVELLPEIEPTPGRTFVFGGDREAFEAARKYVPEPFFNRIGLFFQQLLLKSMAGHNDSYVQQSNITTRKSILEAIEKLFRLPESAGKGKFVYSLAHTTVGQDPTTTEDLFKKFKVYSLHPLSPAGKSFVEYLTQSKTGRKPYIPPPSPAVPAVTASSVPPHYTRRDEEYYTSSSSESESEPEPLPKPVVKQVAKRRVVSNPPTKKKNVYQPKDSDSDSDDDEEVKDFDELIEKEPPRVLKSSQARKDRRTLESSTKKTTKTTTTNSTPAKTPKKKRQSKGSTPSSTKSKSTPTTTPITTTPSTSAAKKRAQTKPESIKWITDHFSIGTRVAAFFSLPTEEGGFENQLYFGTVVRYAAPSKPDKQGDQLYHIQWEDGDEQDYDESELQKGILLYNQENQWIYQHESIGTKVAGEFVLPSQYPSLTNVVRRRKSSNNTIKKKLFIGKVTKFLPATGEKENDQLYHIVWEDGDEEDYYENDLIRGKELYLQYLQDKANDFGNTRNKTIFNDGEDENNDDDAEGKKEGEGDDKEEEEKRRRVHGKEETKIKIKEEVEMAIESEIEKKKRLQEIERRNRRRKRLGLTDISLLDSDEDEEKQEIKRRKREAKEEKEREEQEEENRLKYHNSNNNEEEEEDDDRRTWIKQHSSIGNDVATYITTATIIASTGKTSTRRSLIYGRVMKYSPETRDGKKNQRYLVIWNPNSPEQRTEDKINEVQYQAALALYRATNSSNNGLPAKEEVKSVADVMNEGEEEERQQIIMDEDDEVMVTVNRDRNKNEEGGEGVMKERDSSNGSSNGVEEIPNSFLKIQDDFNDDDISIEINVKRSSQSIITATNEVETAPLAPSPVAPADVIVPTSDVSPPPDTASIEISHSNDVVVENNNADLVESNVKGVSEEIAADNQTDNEASDEVAMDVDEKNVEVAADRLEHDKPSTLIVEKATPDINNDVSAEAVSAMEVEDGLTESGTKNETLTADNLPENKETNTEERMNECQVI